MKVVEIIIGDRVQLEIVSDDPEEPRKPESDSVRTPVTVVDLVPDAYYR